MFQNVNNLNSFLCRTLDVLLASFGILILMPLFLAVVPILKFSGEGEIFFKQARVGKNKKAFSILKFATMLKDSPNMAGGTITVSNDPRILPFGKLLRATKINELPQLVNILIGDMSLVGPRPQALDCFLEFTDYGQDKITTVKPGLTGIGSIFFSNEEKLLANFNGDHSEFYSEHVVPYKEILELWAIEQNDLEIYCKSILLTILKVVFKIRINVAIFFPNAPKPSTILKREFQKIENC